MDQTGGGSCPGSRESQDAPAFLALQNKTEKTDAGTSAARSARTFVQPWDRHSCLALLVPAFSILPALMPVLPPDTESGSPLPPASACQTTSPHARGLPQKRRSARSMPPTIPAPPIRMHRTLPTLPLLHE